MDRRDFLKNSACATTLVALSILEPGKLVQEPKQIDRVPIHEFSLHDEDRNELHGGGYARQLGEVAWVRKDLLFNVSEIAFRDLHESIIAYLGIWSVISGELLRLSPVPSMPRCPHRGGVVIGIGRYSMVIDSWSGL